MLEKDICTSCGDLVEQGHTLCHRCQQEHPPVEMLRSWGVYHDPLQKAIQRFKFQHDLSLGETFSVYMQQVMDRYNWKIDVIVPVPIHEKHRRERGYNQAAMLAIPLALATGGHVLDPRRACIVAVTILWTGGKVGRDSMSGLLDRAAPPEMLAEIRKVIENAGLNQYLLSIVNVREQDAWVTENEDEATAKAKALINGAVYRARLLQPLTARFIDVNPDVMVVGGGIAGIQAALESGVLAGLGDGHLEGREALEQCVGAVRARRGVHHLEPRAPGGRVGGVELADVYPGIRHRRRLTSNPITLHAGPRRATVGRLGIAGGPSWAEIVRSNRC